MNPQERQMVDDLFDRLAKLENAPRDPEAASAIAEGLRKAPNAVYALVQTVLLQDEALKRANAHIQELEAAHAQQQQQSGSGSFLDSMRDAIFGQSNPPQPRSSVPNVPPPTSRPVWNSGQVMQQPPGSGQPGYAAPPYGSSYGAPPFGGGGGSFLGTAAAAAAGMVGGSLLLNSIRGMMGGHAQGFGQPGFGDTTIINEGGSGRPWGDQSGSSMASEAGINDIGRSDNASGSGMFDQAAIDRQQDADQDQDDDQDAMDLDSDDYGSGGDDSNYA
jgi:hypothetical protein